MHIEIHFWGATGIWDRLNEFREKSEAYLHICPFERVYVRFIKKSDKNRKIYRFSVQILLDNVL